MILEEQGQRGLLSFFKKLLNFCVANLKKIYMPKIHKATEQHQIRSLKELMRKNPNMGIHKEIGLTEEQTREIAKQLKRCRQDFVIKKMPDNKYSITVASGNKSLVEALKVDAKTTIEDKNKKPSLKDRLPLAHEKAAELNKEQQRLQRMPEKHKDLSL